MSVQTMFFRLDSEFVAPLRDVFREKGYMATGMGTQDWCSFFFVCQQRYTDNDGFVQEVWFLNYPIVKVLVPGEHYGMTLHVSPGVETFSDLYSFVQQLPEVA